MRQLDVSFLGEVLRAYIMEVIWAANDISSQIFFFHPEKLRRSNWEILRPQARLVLSNCRVLPKPRQYTPANTRPSHVGTLVDLWRSAGDNIWGWSGVWLTPRAHSPDDLEQGVMRRPMTRMVRAVTVSCREPVTPGFAGACPLPFRIRSWGNRLLNIDDAPRLK